MATDRDWPNLATMMFSLARQHRARTMLRFHENGAWHGVSWSEFARRTASLARALRRLGVAPGDRVLLVSEGRPEVPIAETALMALRAVPVPAYTTNTPEDHAHLLLDSGARVAIASTVALADRVLAGAAHLGGLDTLLCMQPGRGQPFLPLLDDPAAPDDVAAEAETIAPGTLACLIYTSGTSGLPRGTMLPHRAILSNIEGVAEYDRPLGLREATYLSYLPLSHSFEHTVGQFIIPAFGGTVAYGRGVEHLAADLQAIRPTILTVVPRILETIRTRIQLQLGRETAVKQRLFDATLAAGLGAASTATTTLAGPPGRPPSHPPGSPRGLGPRFGGNIVALVSGGARLDPDTGRFFQALGVPGPARLRPDRGRPGHQRQPARPRPLPDRRTAPPRRRPPPG